MMATFQQSAPEISLISNTAIITITDNDCEDYLTSKLILFYYSTLIPYCLLLYFFYIKCILHTMFIALYINHGLFSLFLWMYIDAIYSWENPEYKVIEDSGSLAINLCLDSESGTLTFPVEVTITSTPISATGKSCVTLSYQFLLLIHLFAPYIIIIEAMHYFEGCCMPPI